MELTFVKNEKAGSYVAEFEVTADFNLHIEREKGGRILFYQKSQGAGGWAHIDDMGWQDGKPSIDYDFTALVYPKMIKIVSESEPTFASVATDGEVTEIKSQSKEIEVTANGTTVVEPDAGFAYLNKVSVKTNVPTSGGGGSASGNEVFNCEYLDISEVSNKMGWNSVAILAKASSQGMTFIAPPSYNPFGLTGLVAVAVDFNFSIVAESGGQKMEVPIREVLNQNGVTNEDIAAIPRITKEEFYTL